MDYDDERAGSPSAIRKAKLDKQVCASGRNLCLIISISLFLFHYRFIVTSVFLSMAMLCHHLFQKLWSCPAFLTHPITSFHIISFDPETVEFMHFSEFVTYPMPSSI